MKNKYGDNPNITIGEYKEKYEDKNNKMKEDLNRLLYWGSTIRGTEHYWKKN